MFEHRETPAGGMTLYRLTSATAIGLVLQQLQQQGGVLNLYASEAARIWGTEGGADASSAPHAIDADPKAAMVGMARIVEINAEARTVCWEVASPVQPLCSAMVGVAHMHGGVRVQCPVQGEWAQVDGVWRLTMPLPEYLLQWQRRRHHRFAVPLGQNYSASFRFGNRRCVLDIDDLSEAGVALRGSRQETAMLFLGKRISKVQLRMPDGTILEADLQVRARRSYRSFLLGEQVLVGCSIEGMSDEAAMRLHELLAHGMRVPQA